MATTQEQHNQLNSAASRAWQALRVVTPPALRRWYWNTHSRREQARIRQGTHYESHVGAAVRSIIKPGWTCLDVGANRGLITIPLAELVGPNGCVHAFEPHPENIRELRANLTQYGLSDRVHVHEVAVNDGVNERVSLFAGRRQSASEWNIIGRDADGNETSLALEVPARSLDSHFDESTPVHFVKIDVEGAESMVLDGMRRILTRQRPTLIIECHSPDNWQACMALRTLGYTMTDLRDRAIDSDDAPKAHVIARHVGQLRRAA